MRSTPRLTPVQRQDGKESGQVTVLIIGYLLLSLLLVTVVLAVSSVYIEHKKLLSVADGASVAAADSFTLSDVAGAGRVPAAVLNADRVRTKVADYLGKNRSYARFDRLSIDAATGTLDDRTAQVSLTAVVHPPVVNFLVPDGIPITAVSVARSKLTR